MQRNVDGDTECQQSNGRTVASGKLRRHVGRVQERGHNTRAVTNGDLHATGKGPLSVSGIVDADPGEGDAGGYPQTERDDEAAGKTEAKSL